MNFTYKTQKEKGQNGKYAIKNNTNTLLITQPWEAWKTKRHLQRENGKGENFKHSIRVVSLLEDISIP